MNIRRDDLLTHIKTMKNALLSISFFALIGGGFFYCLTTTLDDMTRRDCEYGVQAACEALKK
tara:strand:+ start:793 stop:978 length:186 start_codon:yes stop_codon:yes gene_type:complete